MKTRIAIITRTYTRTYRDNGQTKTYVEWLDDRAQTGRTEGAKGNAHMVALLARAAREGVTHTVEVW